MYADACALALAPGLGLIPEADVAALYVSTRLSKRASASVRTMDTPNCSSGFRTTKHPTANPVENKNNADDDAGELEDSNFVALLCHTGQSASATLETV